jgi:CRISPR/Cas system CSM-associated protein Csm4 (group 5 of RAMP superfamily)
MTPLRSRHGSCIFEVHLKTTLIKIPKYGHPNALLLLMLKNQTFSRDSKFWLILENNFELFNFFGNLVDAVQVLEDAFLSISRVHS